MNPKLELILSPYTGYCFGVKRAMRLIDRGVAEEPGAKIYTLGEIIHNPQAVARLRERGVEPVSSLDLPIQARILKLLYKLKKEESLALLFISHDPAVIRLISDRIIKL